MSCQRLRIPTFPAVVALAVVTACASQPSDAPRGAIDPQVEPSAAITSVDRAAPVGKYVLTDDIAIVIEPATSSADADHETWTIRIGDDAGHAIVSQPDAGWRVAALDMHIAAAERDGVAGLRLRRYGETVFAPRAAPSTSVAPARGAPIEGALNELTPRLMIGLDVPGVGIALIRDGEIAWRGYFGVERAGESVGVDSTTVFEAASMSKPAWTYPFMTLVERGIIDLDTPLVDYLGEDYIAGDTLHRAITARMVLSHTSGFPNWRDDDGLTVEFVPGTRIGYSGEGFQYLQTVVEEVTGTPMAEFADETLFQPLGLESASYVWRPEYDTTMATGHTEDGNPNPRRPYTDANAAYTLYITPADYARILIEIMRADRSAPHSLSETTRAMMLEPQHVAPDRDPIARGGISEGEVHFALGWRLDRTSTGDRYWHSGSNSTGFQCYAEFDPTTGDGIVIMTNSSSGSPLWRALMNATGQP